jgi:hypothetical protein
MTRADLHIRQAESRDRKTLDELIVSTLRDSLGNTLPDDELELCIITYQHQASSNPCYIAEIDGTLMGYAVVRSQGDTSSHPLKAIERLYVRRDILPHATQRLVVSSLLVALWEPSRGNNATPANAAVDAATALALYDRWHFVDPSIIRRCLSLPSGEGRILTDEAVAV